MPLFTVMRRGEPPVTIDAPNWIVAMGNGIQALGGDTAIDRLACEMLANGTVIARDVRSGIGYVVLPVSDALTPLDVEDDSSAEMMFGELDEDTVERTLDEALEQSQDLEDDLDVTAEPALVEVMAAVTGAANAATAWERALEGALRVVPGEAGAAVEATPQAGLLFVAVLGEMSNQLRAMRLPYGKGFVGFCIDRCTALMVADAQADERHYDAVDQATGFHTGAVAVVPIASGDRVFGCLEVLNPPAGRFTRGDLARLEQVAVALASRLVHTGVRGRERG